MTDSDVTEPEEPPDYDSSYARKALGVAIAVAVVVLAKPAWQAWELSEDDWLGEAGDQALTASLSLPVTIIGAILVALGAWMAVVEWRGRFKREPAGEKRPSIAPDPNAVGEIIAAVGKLRGAGLVLVVGAILMITGAWAVAESTDNPEGGSTAAPGNAADTPDRAGASGD